MCGRYRLTRADRLAERFEAELADCGRLSDFLQPVDAAMMKNATSERAKWLKELVELVGIAAHAHVDTA